MVRWRVWSIAAFAVCAGGVTAWLLVHEAPHTGGRGRATISRSQQARDYLFAELQPVRLANCAFQRFGEPHDGGYVMCSNLLASVQSGYSYGISGYDQWGCDISRRLGVTVHQYDCFDLHRPACLGGKTMFHAECIAGQPATIEGRIFDTFENQFAKNGDGARRLVLKIDVEGAEWESFLQTPDAVLDQLDQLVVEFHGVEERFIMVVWKLKQSFHVANLHFNNFSCDERLPPFPAWAYEVLFVNKRVGLLGPSGTAGPPNGLNAPNNPGWKDCQSTR